MARVRPPAVPDHPPPVLRAEELERLLAACAGTSFEERRDTAIIRLLASTGMRSISCRPVQLHRAPSADVTLEVDTCSPAAVHATDLHVPR